MNYPSPIQPNKQTTDREFNEAIEFCIDHINRVAVVVASHNEYSNLLTTQLLQQKNCILE